MGDRQCNKKAKALKSVEMLKKFILLEKNERGWTDGRQLGISLFSRARVAEIFSSLSLARHRIPIYIYIFIHINRANKYG